MKKFSILTKHAKLSTRARNAAATTGIAVFLATGFSNFSFADTVETKGGARLVGTITQIDGANIVVKTAYAGEIKVKTAEVVSLSTDAPINVRLADGTVALGTASMGASAGAPGALVINTAKGPVSTGIANIAATWADGAKDPDLVKLEHHWSFEAGLDITGKTGNSNQFGTSVSLRATLQSSYDILKLYTGYDRQVTDGNKSADQGRLGADYQDNFYGRLSWYARDELGFNRVKLINLYNTAAAGLGYDLVKTKIDTLTIRAGLAHRYESYSPDPVTGLSNPNLSAMALDTGLVNDLKMKTWSMHNLITYTPTFNDFNNYHFYHESYIELPLANPHWRFRVGISNDYYNPLPIGASKRLDTTYFARLVLNW